MGCSWKACSWVTATEGHLRCDSTQRRGGKAEPQKQRAGAGVSRGFMDRSRGHSSDAMQTKPRLTVLQEISFKIIYSCHSAKFGLLPLSESFIVSLF